MPAKPIKWGFKFWVLCEAETGYILYFIPYTGASDKPVEGLGYKVVMELVKDHLYKNHHVYADNYFTSIQLASDLLDKDTYMCGTINKNRAGIIKNQLYMNSIGISFLSKSVQAAHFSNKKIILIFVRFQLKTVPCK